MMRLPPTAVLAGLAWATATGAVIAHHSFAMFDTEHPIEIAGTVKEFRFVNPHTILIVEVKGQDGSVKSWTLESGAPGLQAREGMTARSLKPGDEVVVTISPLHSGAAAGSFQLPQIKFKDGRPVVVPR
jgi:hypothetical protein